MRTKQQEHISLKYNVRGPIHAVLLSAVLVLGVTSCFRTSQVSTTTAVVAPPRPDLLVYGVNMALYDNQDYLVNDAATRALFRRYHVPIVRMPFRPGLPDSYEFSALQAIKDIGAIPLVIIHGPSDPGALDNDRHAIALVQRVFGDSVVYVEFGNEPDLNGIDVWRYINSWNHIVPLLKAAAPNYRFIGPVNFQSDPVYIATFDEHATPRPDLNSWHEYACTRDQPDDWCLTQTTNWTQHIRATNDAVRSAIGTTLPVMITEWNLDAYEDERYSNVTFMQKWTSLAMQTLTASMSIGLLAAMQYCATNNAELELVDGAGRFTPEGQAFFHLLGHAAGTG